MFFSFLDFLLLDDHHFSLGFFLFGEWWLGTDQWAVGNWFLTLEGSYVVRSLPVLLLWILFSLFLSLSKKRLLILLPLNEHQELREASHFCIRLSLSLSPIGVIFLCLLIYHIFQLSPNTTNCAIWSPPPHSLFSLCVFVPSVDETDDDLILYRFSPPSSTRYDMHSNHLS